MKLEEIYAALAAIENGAAMTADIKTEINRLRNEAGGYRTQLQKVTTTLGLKDAENLDEAVTSLKTSLDAIEASGSKPNEIGTKLATLMKQVETLTQTVTEKEKLTAAEKEKRIAAVRTAKTVEALTAAKAVAPSELAKILAGNVQIKEDDSIVFVGSDGKELPLNDGIAGYLKANPVFVANSAAPGAGGGSGGAPNDKDPDKMSMEEYIEWRKAGGGK